MNEEIFNKKLRELIHLIAGLPEDQQKQLTPLVKETQERHAEISNNFNRIANSLNDLRIGVKYLLFDLEATKRELEDLREKYPED